MYNLDNGINTLYKPEYDGDFFVNIGFELGGKIVYINSTALQAAFKDDDFKALSFYDVIKRLSKE